MLGKYLSPLVALVLFTMLQVLMVGVALFPTELQSARVLVTLISAVISLLVGYSQLFVPLSQRMTERHKILSQVLLETLRARYRELRPGSYHLRANVMLVRKRFSIVGKLYLGIDVTDGDYRMSEIEQRYDSNVGCCGTALAENSLIYYDARSRQEYRKGMTDTQKQVTEQVKSILSVPVYRLDDRYQKSPIAVLNLDSENYIDETGFETVAVQNLAFKFAALIGTVHS